MLCIENALVDSFHFIITCDGMVEVEDQDQSTLTRADAATPATDRTIGLLGQAVKTVENINSIPTGATYALRIIHRNHLSPQNEPIDYRDGKALEEIQKISFRRAIGSLNYTYDTSAFLSCF